MKKCISKKTIISLFIAIITVILLYIPTSNAAEDIIVILDPGHGGYESGAVRGNYIEKDLNWKIATRVKEILDSTPGITGILTRGQNDNPSLYERGLLAKNMGADLLVSFHINSSDYTSSASGAEVYITGNTNSPRFYQNSYKFGEDVLSNLRSIGVPSNRYKPLLRFSTDGELYSDGFLSDWYGIIRNPMYYGIPGVLIEHCYINNAYDRANFLNDNMLNRMAEQDAKAIIDNKENFRIDKTTNSIGVANYKLEISTNSNGQPYLYGEVLVNNWVNGMRANPSSVPIIRLKSTDGTVSYNCWSIVSRDNIYYFDTLLDPIDKNKEYYIEVETTEKQIIPKYYVQTMQLNNKTLGYVKDEEVKVEDNKITFELEDYVGDLANEVKSLEITKNGDNNYITGRVIVTEWINGSIWSIPKRIPKVTLKSEDNEVKISSTVKQISGNEYEFNIPLNSADTTKTYEIEIEAGSENNISKYRKTIADYNKDGKIGSIPRKDIQINDNKITFININYKGDLATETRVLEAAQNEKGETYIKGEMNITEWIGTLWNIPDTLPAITIKSEDGSEEFSCWVNPIGNNTYYFDTYIEGIDVNKRYNIEVSLTNEYNISKYKTGKATYDKNKTLGKYQGQEIKIINSQILFGKDKYSGDISTEITQMTLNGTKLEGEINISEWINGTTWSIPRKMPIMRLKTTDGDVISNCIVSQINQNRYKYMVDINNIDVTKEYVLEVESGSIDNQSKYKITNAYCGKDMAVGTYNDMRVIYSNNKIIFKDNKYNGDIATQITKIGLNNNQLTGTMNITEWIDGVTWSIPRELPLIRIESIDGKIIKECIVKQDYSNQYSFSVDLDDDIDTTKQYVLKIESGSKDNQSKYKMATSYYGKNAAIGIYQNMKMMYENEKIIFKDNKYRGDIAAQLVNISIKNDLLTGEVYITEWIDGITWAIPTKLPVITLENSKEETIKTANTAKISGNLYKFSINLDKVELNNEYKLKARSGDENNTSKYKVTDIKVDKETNLGTYKGIEIKMIGSKIYF